MKRRKKVSVLIEDVIVAPKKTISIQLYGGPGTGKSTTAADLFVELKKKKVNCELVREYIKDWVWEERKILATDQIYILAKQARREQILFNKVDVMISDSPVWMVPIYEKKYSKKPFVTQKIVDKFESECKDHNIEHVHIFLNRVKKYNPAGRFQTESEAKKIDIEIKKHLKSLGIKFITIDADNKAAKKIIKKLSLA